MVTGGLGFIGSNFVLYLLAKHEDITIVNVDNKSTGSNPANLKDIEGSKRYRFIKGDITDSTLVKKLVKDKDVIVNFAAETHVDRSIANPTPFFKSNTQGIFTLLEAVRASSQDVKIIQISTDEVYGEIATGSYKEDDPLRPSNPYSASKAAAEMFCSAYHRTYGLNVVVTRCTNNFGPYQNPEKFIPKTIVRAILTLPISIYGTGKNVRDWIYVLVHGQALDTVVRKGIPGEIYNISGGNELTNLEVVNRILRIMDKPQSLMVYVEDRPGHDLRYSLDSSKIRREMNWRPRYSFNSALEETIDWYLENEEWWRPLATEDVLNPTPWKSRR